MEKEKTPSECSDERPPLMGREMRNLIKSAKESKMLTEFVKINTKKRKSRRESTHNNNKKSKVEISKKIKERKKSYSCHRMDTEIRVRSDVNDFENFFENLYSYKVIKRGSSCPPENTSITIIQKKKKSAMSIIKLDKNGRTTDPFCWKCHKIGTKIGCFQCPKSFHLKCISNKLSEPDESQFVCFECLNIKNSEDAIGRSPDSKLNLTVLVEFLHFALNRMMGLSGSEPFLDFVDTEEFPEYLDCIVQPMCLNKLRQNISDHHYKCTASFLVDCKWILHNSIIFNGAQGKLTNTAKSLMKAANEETREMELCTECYRNANMIFSTWFTEVCNPPHILVWAKLKGFPYWPAKAMTVSNGMVDARFFGAHDKSWVPIKDCFLYSVSNPNGNLKMKQEDIRKAITEVNIYIKNVKFKFLKFEPAPFRTPYNPDDNNQHSTMFPALKYCVELPLEFKKSITPSSPPADSAPPVKTDTDKTIVKTTVKNILNDVCSSKMQPKVVLDTSIRNMIVKSKNKKTNGVRSKSDSPEKIDSAKNVNVKKRKSLITTKKPIKTINKRKRLCDIEIKMPVKMNNNSLKIGEKVKDVADHNNSSEMMLEYMAALKMSRNNNQRSERSKTTSESLVDVKSRISKKSEKINMSLGDNQIVDDIKPDISNLLDNDNIEDEKPDFLSPQIEDFFQESLENHDGDEDNKNLSELIENKLLNRTNENITDFEEKEYQNKPDENKNPKETGEGETENTSQDKSISPKNEKNLMPKITDVRSEYDMTLDKLKPLIAFSKKKHTNGETGSKIELPSKLSKRSSKVLLLKSKNLINLKCLPQKLAPGLKMTHLKKKLSSPAVNLPLATSLSDSIPIPLSTNTEILQTPDMNLTNMMISNPEVNPETDLWSGEEKSVVSLSLQPNLPPQIKQATSLRDDNLSKEIIEDMNFSDSFLESDKMSDLLMNDSTGSSQNKKISLSKEITIKRVKKSAIGDCQWNNRSLSLTSECSDTVPTSSRQTVCTNLEVQNDASKSSRRFYEMLDKNSAKLTATFKNLFLDMMQAKNADFLDPNATILSLKIEIDRLKYMHKKLIEEIYHNTGLEQMERNHVFETDKDGIKKEMKWHMNKKIEHIKSKQWCVACRCEAEYQCCWVTWYCSNTCQKKHWTTHVQSCYHIPQNGQKSVNSKYFNLKFMPKLTSDPRSNKNKSDNVPAPIESNNGHQFEDMGDCDLSDE